MGPLGRPVAPQCSAESISTVSYSVLLNPSFPEFQQKRVFKKYQETTCFIRLLGPLGRHVAPQCSAESISTVSYSVLLNPSLLDFCTQRFLKVWASPPLQYTKRRTAHTLSDTPSSLHPWRVEQGSGCRAAQHRPGPSGIHLPAGDPAMIADWSPLLC